MTVHLTGGQSSKTLADLFVFVVALTSTCITRSGAMDIGIIPARTSSKTMSLGQAATKRGVNGCMHIGVYVCI